MTPKMRHLLAQASIIAEASAMTLDPKTSHGKASTIEPRSEGQSTYDQIRQRFESARTPAEQNYAVAWAEAELRKITRRSTRDLTADQTLYWVIYAAQGKDYRDVAQENGLSEKTVWKLRREAGFDPRKGLPK